MKKTFFALLLVAALAAAGCSSNAGSAIQASGQIEAKQVSVSAELSGRVAQVLVAEGDSVKSGDVLLRLDDSQFTSQQQAAQAALDAAQANQQAAQAGLDAAQAQYDLTLSNALAAEEPDRQDNWDKSKPNAYDRPVWYYSRDEQIQSVQNEIDTATAALAAAQDELSKVEKDSANADFMEIESRLSDARASYDVAKDVLNSSYDATESRRLRDAAQTDFNSAVSELNSAQSAYDDALTSDSALDVLKARAKAAVAQERYYAAQDALRELQTGAYSPAVTAAAKGVDQAQAVLDQAGAAISAAQAQLDLANVQIDKLTVSAPMDGVVLTRSIEAGEVLQAGATALTIGDLTDLKVTVYIPETQYGQISLGQNATLVTDSFPGESFQASVTRIADQAEYTPQNVQTKEGRQTTVYAVELSLDNSDGKLKPGMPVDVTFGS